MKVKKNEDKINKNTDINIVSWCIVLINEFMGNIYIYSFVIFFYLMSVFSNYVFFLKK